MAYSEAQKRATLKYRRDLVTLVTNHLTNRLALCH